MNLFEIGAWMFITIEGEFDYTRAQNQNSNMEKIREDVTTQLWNITLQLNNFNRSTFMNE